MWTGAINGTSSCHEVTSRFFATNAPNPLRWTLKSCFRVLHSVWVHLLSFCNYMKFDAKRGKLVQLMQSSWHEVTSGFFAMNTPNPPHWTLNSCFRKFHSVWVHLLWFRNCMKLSAQRCELVQLMQKFMPPSHVRIFCNERIQYTPLDPKLMFFCVL